MKQLIEKILPTDNRKRKWTAIGLTVIVSGLLTLWGIYEIGQYGIALFILTPLFIGAGSTILYGRKKGITKRQAWQIGLLTLTIFTAGLLVFAIEGIICIAMAAPIALLLTWIGSLIGHAIINKTPHNASTTLLLLVGIIPTMAFIEKNNEPALTSVVTSIEINAPPQTVWKNVIEFPQLDKPTEFIFKTGIAYPIDAKIEGTSVGAVRHCNFTTGSFVEPITVWNEPRLLKFDVVEQPAPMKELSFWNIDAPHLHDYFVSKQGQFKLTALPNGKTLLEGTTWYYHNIKPAFYWQLWSNYIIHKIHNRVLTHIKTNAEHAEKKKYRFNTKIKSSFSY
ncbi:SRPBCC family protein [Pedobacter sp. ASV28]|uniref:SRPBCC family protein n=1 Tax=Pedobacter sp. ASV28 TaxID=2795123 RepID=UPI0018EB5322|nr:SRPBCC family protein [Pedobacter sp. ASV28]